MIVAVVIEVEVVMVSESVVWKGLYGDKARFSNFNINMHTRVYSS